MSMLCKRKGVKIVEAEICPDHCTHVSRNSAKHKCIVFCRVLKRKEYINDIRKTCKSEVQIWKQTFLVSYRKNAKKIQEYIANQLQDDGI